MQNLIRGFGNILAGNGRTRGAEAVAGEPAAARAAERYRKTALILLCLTWTCAVGLLDLATPTGMDLDLLYLAGCAFAGWAAGLIPALLLAMISGAFLFVDAAQAGALGFSGWVAYWNPAIRFVAISAVGWLGFELGKRTRRLEATLRERAVRLRNAVEKHKETAQFLREALRVLKQITENIADVFWVTDASKTRFEFVSPQFERLWGEPCAAVLDSPATWLERVHPEDRERLTRATFHRPASEGYDEEYRVVRTDGVVRWVRDRAFPVKDENGAVYRLVGIAEDITERKRTQHLLQAERDLGAALGSTSDLQFALERLVEITTQLESIDCGGVYLMDPETGDLHLRAHRGVSDAILSRSSHRRGTDPEARLAREGKLVYLHNDEIPRAQGVLWGGQGFRALALVPLRNKESVLGLLILGSYRQDEISPETRVGLEVIATQAAGALARIAAEDASRRSEAHVRSIVNSAPIALLAADAHGRVTFEDGQALAAMGCRPAEHLKQPVTAVFRDNPVLLDDLDRAQAGEEFSSVVEFGSMIFENRYTPTPERDGQRTGFIAVATDVTERLRLQRQVLEISDREQARIGQDVHDGLCQQLIGTALKANSLQKSLSEKGLAEAAAAQKICGLLDETITESRRVCRGLYPVRLKTEGLIPALEELAHSAGERNKLPIQFTTDSPDLRCDETTATHLYRIAQEAVNNAIKHSDCSTVEIRLSSLEDEIELAIQDDGTGVKPAKSTSGGMGFHIMDYRARSIGGRLRVNSEAGGTTVTCRLGKPQT